MRRLVAAAVVMLAVLAGPAAVTGQEDSVLGRIMAEIEAAGFPGILGEMAEIDEETMERVTEIRNEADAQIRKAESEVDILKARVRRLLLDDDPDLDEIEDLLREVSEWELEIRMTEIRRDVRIRTLIGDNAWARLLQSRRILSEAQRLRMEAATRERLERLEDELLGREQEYFRRRLHELEERLEQGGAAGAERIERLRRELEERLRDSQGSRY